MISYELAKQLKDAGFPLMQIIVEYPDKPNREWMMIDGRSVYIPTLSELIEACGDDFGQLWAEQNVKTNKIDHWFASPQEIDDMEIGVTPEEAVAKLWLALKN